MNICYWKYVKELENTAKYDLLLSANTSSRYTHFVCFNFESLCGRNICGDTVMMQYIRQFFRPLATAYLSVFQEALAKHSNEFFGLRDFYRFAQNDSLLFASYVITFCIM